MVGRSIISLSIRKLSVLIDKEDLQKVSEIKWSAFKAKNDRWYINASIKSDGKRKTIYLHRIIVDAPSDLEVDHVNGDTLDNRKQNLRIVTHRQNQCNFHKARTDSKTGVRGVTFHKSNKRFECHIWIYGRRVYVGSSKDLDEADKLVELARDNYYKLERKS